MDYRVHQDSTANLATQALWAKKVLMDLVVPPVLTEPPEWPDRPDHPEIRELQARKELMVIQAGMEISEGQESRELTVQLVSEEM